MYFVTSKRAGYVLFCMTPSGRAAIGLGGRSQRPPVRTLTGRRVGDDCASGRRGTLSHTDLMLALGEHDEPDDPRRLLDLVPRA